SLALRNFDLEDMELESTYSGPTAKLPMLKLGEYEVPISQTTEENGIITSKVSTPTIASRREDKEKE
ncbi:hypothetical protein Tco_0557008, partial [Tanacetum coccineum]